MSDTINITTIIAVFGLILACISLLSQWYLVIYKPERVAIQFEPKLSRNTKISKGNKFSGGIRIRNKGDYDTSITSITFLSNNPNVKLTKLADSEDIDYLVKSVITLSGGILKILFYEIECEKPPTTCKNALFIFDIPARKRGMLEKKLTIHFL